MIMGMTLHICLYFNPFHWWIYVKLQIRSGCTDKVHSFIYSTTSLPSTSMCAEPAVCICHAEPQAFAHHCKYCLLSLVHPALPPASAQGDQKANPSCIPSSWDILLIFCLFQFSDSADFFFLQQQDCFIPVPFPSLISVMHRWCEGSLKCPSKVPLLGVLITIHCLIG